ncbi:saccharopine dehydrogenase family protein [Halostella litorea]|uniref:saccharopine dehydrogenase family protein n=1 Tax=Halostella litorea TaxID=2528831 RepID=UPI0010923E34|nr:saccharopine dehydrogenase NADP-binding domain-containing protein [Halostella litorea]
MAGELLVYGSYGYTGELITDAATERGLDPTVAGRDAAAVEQQATELGLAHRVFGLDYPGVVCDAVADADAVLNCAGPFAATTEPLVRACLATGTDYLDLTGELDVIEWVAERDREAERAGVSLLPGVGFDVAATDCLAAYLESQLRSATRLTLAIDGFGSASPGTMKSMIRGLPRGGAVRRNGVVTDVPPAWRTREFDFGDGPALAATVPWGDVSSAYYTTGIPNIDVYAAMPRAAVRALRWSAPLLPLFAAGPVQSALTAVVDAAVSGPTDRERAKGTVRIHGEVADDAGNRVAARLATPDPYDLTTETAVAAAERTLSGDAPDGFGTPASAFGADFVLDVDGVRRLVTDAERAPAAR